MIQSTINVKGDKPDSVDVIIKGDFTKVLEEYKCAGRALMSALSEAPDPIEAITDIANMLNYLTEELTKIAHDVMEDE